MRLHDVQAAVRREVDTAIAKVELTFPELQAVAIDPWDSALVIVDMQNEFLKPEGRHYMRGRAEHATGNLSALLSRFRLSGITVIYVQSVRAPTNSLFTVFGQSPIVIEGTWNAAIVDDLKPLTGEAIVPKHSPDCFNHTAMEAVLAERHLVPGRSHIVVAGCSANGCVDCAVVGFSVRDYRVSVPVDCTAAMTESAELLGYAHYFGLGFDHNVIPTRSDLIQIQDVQLTERHGHVAARMPSP
jgi:nicotinamidase-related amidase